MQRFRDSRYVAGLYSRHPCAKVKPSCRHSEHSRMSEQGYISARMWGKTDTDMLVSVSRLDDSTQRLSMSSIPLPAISAPFISMPEGRGVTAPFDKMYFTCIRFIVLQHFSSIIL